MESQPRESVEHLEMDPRGVSQSVLDDDTHQLEYHPEYFRGVTSIPPVDGCQEIAIRASIESRLLMVALLISVIIFTLFYWDAFGVVNQKLVLVLNSVLLLGTVDYFQKVYLFKAKEVTRRVLFVWRSYPLPDSFLVKRESSGQVVIVDERTNRPILIIGRDMATPTMIDALRDLYHFSSSSSFEID